ncbi:MAG: CaiB/BaiF CoA-transferase family protein [Pseudomonadales bacterium]|jgi:crotonobetainyl-CoA:carnitine CoA-transferase CaiB-like acyl-CoA transferase
MNGPLSHVRVLDLTHARAGPTAVRLLADWGAEVIKIEPPPTGSGRGVTGARRGPDEQNLHRNKKSLTLDLKQADGLRIFMDLAGQADVIVENFKAEVKHRLGVDYEAVRRVNPAIIYASISGFGQEGPYSDRAGVDQIIQGMSGLMSITGEPGRGPWRVGIAISDTTAGMFLGQGILMALLHRERTGEGQWVHTSLLEAMMNKLDFQGARYTMKGEVPEQQGNDHPTQFPMGTFRAKDGPFNLAAPSQRLWERMCEALEAKDLEENASYRTGRDRAAHKDELLRDINAVTERFTTDELVERLNAAGVPCGPINDIGQAFEDPQVRHLKMAKMAPHATLGDVGLIRSPINLSRFPQSETFDRAAPDPGEDSEAILRDAGYSPERIAEFKAAGVI